MNQAKPVVIVIGGPTASGKTALGITLASKLGTEIISADSRQLYKELSIGVARPTAEELSMAVHHLIASHSVKQPLSAGGFAKEASITLRKLLNTHGIAIVVGGTGLYIQALLQGLDSVPEVPLHLRQEIDALFENEGLDGVQKALLKLDPNAEQRVVFDNPARVKRALELVTIAGKSLEDIYEDGKKNKRSAFEDCTILKFWLNPKRDLLYERINQRCDNMISDGFLEEVKSCLPFREINPLKTVGYTEAFQYIDGSYSYETFIELFKQRSRNYAKRQVTWFKNSKDFVPLDNEKAADRIFELLTAHGYTVHQ